MAKIQVEDVSPAGDWTFSGTVTLSNIILTGTDNLIFYENNLISYENDMVYCT